MNVFTHKIDPGSIEKGSQNITKANKRAFTDILEKQKNDVKVVRMLSVESMIIMETCDQSQYKRHNGFDSCLSYQLTAKCNNIKMYHLSISL